MNKRVTNLLEEEKRLEEQLAQAHQKAIKQEREAHQEGQKIIQEHLNRAKLQAAGHEASLQDATKRELERLEETTQEQLQQIRAINPEELAKNTQA